MTKPTDAERATARAILGYGSRETMGYARDRENKLATVLATARAEGWRAGVEAAAQEVPEGCHCYRASRAVPVTAHPSYCPVAIAAKIRALAGPGEREGT